MNSAQAAKRLKVSVRSLQRLANKHHLTVTYQRGNSGKQEAHYNLEEINKLKGELSQPTLRENVSLTTTPDVSRQTQLVAPQFASALLNLIEQVQRKQEPEVKNTLREVAIEDKPLLKLDEASALTGLSRGTLREAINSGRLKAKVIGRAWRIKRGDLDFYIKEL
jgi:excisionase family DNA binding protein